MEKGYGIIILTFIVIFIFGFIIQDKPDIRVACVGDSITVGTNLTNPSVDSYPAQLKGLLGDGWDVRNYGVPGATMLKNGCRPIWTQKEFEQAKDFNPDIVMIILGTNDVQLKNWKGRQEFAKDYEDMIDTLSDLPAKPDIFIVYPSPIHSKWEDVDKRLRDEIIPTLTDIGDRMGVTVIDAYTPLEGRGDLFPDTVHPNEEGAGIIAQEVYQAIKGLAGR